MDFSKILNQVLDSAKEAATNGLIKGDSKQDQIAKIGGGAAAIGLISMIFGRKGGANMAKLGSLAALGSLAYQAFQKYQAENAQTAELTPPEAVNENLAGQLILQAMIAAAAADGTITEDEKYAILAQANDNEALLAWIKQEMDNPASINEIAAKVGNNSALAAQVYLAARAVCANLARKEIIFLANLADALKLPEALVEQLEKDAGF